MGYAVELGRITLSLEGSVADDEGKWTVEENVWKALSIKGSSAPRGDIRCW